MPMRDKTRGRAAGEDPCWGSPATERVRAGAVVSSGGSAPGAVASSGGSVRGNRITGRSLRRGSRVLGRVRAGAIASLGGVCAGAVVSSGRSAPGQSRHWAESAPGQPCSRAGLRRGALEICPGKGRRGMPTVLPGRSLRLFIREQKQGSDIYDKVPAFPSERRDSCTSKAAPPRGFRPYLRLIHIPAPRRGAYAGTFGSICALSISPARAAEALTAGAAFGSTCALSIYPAPRRRYRPPHG